MSNKRNAIKTSTISTHRELQQWQGPLPPPESLAKYDEYIPGSAQTIIDMAVKEQEHRHIMEERALNKSSRLAMTSTILGFVCVILLVGLVIYSIIAGAYNTALAAIISAIATVAGIFVLRRRFRENK